MNGMEFVEYWSFVLRVLVGAGCGLLVGIDREIKKKPLGARAFILTGAACAAWTATTINFSLDLADVDGSIGLDPTRLIQGIVGAIGFLGAGAIISTSDNGHLRGIASGAAIWGVGACGVAAGMGYLAEAATLAVFYFIILMGYDLLFGDRADDDDTGQLGGRSD